MATRIDNGGKKRNNYSRIVPAAISWRHVLCVAYLVKVHPNKHTPPSTFFAQLFFGKVYFMIGCTQQNQRKWYRCISLSMWNTIVSIAFTTTQQSHDAAEHRVTHIHGISITTDKTIYANWKHMRGLWTHRRLFGGNTMLQREKGGKRHCEMTKNATFYKEIE